MLLIPLQKRFTLSLPSLVISSATISFIVHTTEDSEKLITTVSDCFRLHGEEISKQELEGHFGNKMFYIKTHLTGERADRVSRMLLSKLQFSSKKRLMTDLEKYLNEHDALYLRIDRQSLPEELVLGDDEAILVKLKPKLRRDRKSVVRGFQEMMKA